MFKAKIFETFAISGRGTVLALGNVEGTVQVGDLYKSRDVSGVISGIEMINRRSTPKNDHIGVLVSEDKSAFQIGDIFEQRMDEEP